MKKLFYISCAILAVFSEGSSFAAKKTSQAIESAASSEARCIAEINNVRQQHGLQPLKAWTQLSDCARGHSHNMANGKCPFGHDGFDQRANHMWGLASLSSFAENVAYNYNYDDPMAVAVDGWMKSQGHKKNILGDFDETGMGVVISNEGKVYFTQLFAKRQKSRS